MGGRIKSESAREAEALAAVKGRDPTAQAISLMVGLDPNSQPLFHAFEVTEKERRQADLLAEQLFAAIKGRKSPSAIEYAALARVLEMLSSNIEDAA
jgi:hypothetical protein